VKGIRIVAVAVVALLIIGTRIALAQDEEASGGEATSSLSAAPDPQPGSEVVADRTATSETFRLPDGQRETRLYGSPVNYRDEEGDWQPIEEGFEELPNGQLANGANSFDTRLPERLGDGPVLLAEDGVWVSSELLSANPEAAQIEGESATYETTSGGTSFEFSSLPDGLKETIEIADPSQPSTFHYALDASSGLTPELSEEGAIDFRDEEGNIAAELPAPTIADSAAHPAISRAVHYKLTSTGQGTWGLTVEADREWLSDPQREWPVRIDPSTIIKFGPTLDCGFMGWTGEAGERRCASPTWTSYPTSSYYPAPPAKAFRSRLALRFDVSSIPSTASITEATLALHASTSASNTSGVEVMNAMNFWTNLLNWMTRDGRHAWTTGEGGYFASLNQKIETAQRGSQSGWWNFSDTRQSGGLRELVDSWKTGKTVNDGLFVKLIDDSTLSCTPGCFERSIIWDSSAAPETSSRPYLAVTYYPKAPVSSKIVSPTEGTVTSGKLKLKSKWSEAGVQGITFQYKTGSDAFKTIPTSLVHKANGEEAHWPMAVSGFESEPLYFDALHATPALTERGGDVEIRAVYEGPIGIEGYSEAAKAKVDPDRGGPKDATASVGPGSVDLLTGSFTLSRTDVSIAGTTAGLEFARSHDSRSPGVVADTSVLGRGWKPTVPVEAAGGAEWRSVKEVNPSAEEAEEGIAPYVLLTDLEGYEYAFELLGGNYVSPPEFTGWVLGHVAGSATFTLSDPTGNSTTFENSGGGAEYLPVSASVAGLSNTTTMVYEFIGGNRRLQEIISPNSNFYCTTENATTFSGCRTLVFNYQPATTWGAPGVYGDRLASIVYYGPTPEKTEASWEVAKYKYDTSGRLIAEWDPRISPTLEEKYTYVGSGESTPQGGELKTITPSGQEPWTLEYSSLPGEEAGVGRLKSVKRPSLIANPTVAQTTIAYGVPLTGSGAPYAMGGSDVAQWGQTDIPTDATAVFPPDEVPASPPSSWAHATVYYMDAEGMQVNTATPSGGGTSAPSITTTETDEYGNVVRELTAQNRLRALSASTEAEKIAKSHELETKREYLAEGIELRQEWGPMHQVRLESGTTVRAQLHTTIQYNEGWPGTEVNPHLPTRVTTGAKIPKQGEDADQKVTETRYDWTLRKPTETIVDPKGLNLRTRTAYNLPGQVIETSLPAKPEGGDAHTTKTLYYTAGPNHPDESCGHKSNFAGLPCVVMPVAQPGTPGQPELLVTRYASYNQLAQPLEVIQSPGGNEAPEATRKTIKTYDAAGRPTSSKRVGGGTELPPTATVYSSTSGLPVEQKFTCEVKCEGFDSQAVVTEYDKLGRPVKYTDADANSSTTTYDVDGRRVTTTDGKGTQTRTYDPTSGLLTKLEDSAAGTFTAAYDAEGNMTEEGLPDGLVAKTTYDETGQPAALSYVKTNCSEKCTWLEESNERSIYGQVLAQKSLASSEQYSYDRAGRLLTAQETPTGGGCTTRIYAYDQDSNRTSLTSRAPEVNGSCKTSGGTVTTYSYDSADRLGGEGVAYDSFGRITSLPGKYAGGSALETTFYSNEMIATQSQSSVTNTYQLDASGRVRERTRTGGGNPTEVFHYAMASDSTAWIDRGSSWVREIDGIGGDLAATQQSSGEISLQLADLHGDVVGTTGISPSETKLTASYEYDEFGRVLKGGFGRYGWLGGKGRRTELSSGVIQMGKRSYVPSLGRFLSVDPKLGGSANPYDYANQDPINKFDLGGCEPEPIHKCVVKCVKAHCGGHNYAKAQNCIAHFSGWKAIVHCVASFCDTLPIIKCIAKCPTRKPPPPPKPPHHTPPPAPVPAPAPAPEPVPAPIEIPLPI